MLLLAAAGMTLLVSLSFLLYARMPRSILNLTSSHSRFAGLGDSREMASSVPGSRGLTSLESMQRAA